MNKNNFKILVCESDLAIQENITEYLSSSGYTVETVKSNSEILKTQKLQTSHIVILDCAESENFTVDTIRELHSVNSTIEIIVMLSNPTIRRIFRLVDSGIHNILIKPLSLNDIGTNIDKAINQYKEKYEFKVFLENRELILKLLNDQGVQVFEPQNRNIETIEV